MCLGHVTLTVIRITHDYTNIYGLQTTSELSVITFFLTTTKQSFIVFLSD